MPIPVRRCVFVFVCVCLGAPAWDSEIGVVFGVVFGAEFEFEFEFEFELNLGLNLNLGLGLNLNLNLDVNSAARLGCERHWLNVPDRFLALAPPCLAVVLRVSWVRLRARARALLFDFVGVLAFCAVQRLGMFQV